MVMTLSEVIFINALIGIEFEPEIVLSLSKKGNPIINPPPANEVILRNERRSKIGFDIIKLYSGIDHGEFEGPFLDSSIIFMNLEAWIDPV